MKLTVVKEFTFEAAHYLPDYDGPCRNLHGHSYKLKIGVTDFINQETGMAIDFSRLKQTVEKYIISFLDHKSLNVLLPLPTAENLVEWIYTRLKYHWDIGTISWLPSFIQLYETPTSYAEWRRE